MRERTRRMFKRIGNSSEKKKKRIMDYAKSWLRKRGIPVNMGNDRECFSRVPGGRIIVKVLKVLDTNPSHKISICEVLGCSACNSASQYFRRIDENGLYSAGEPQICCIDLMARNLMWGTENRKKRYNTSYKVYVTSEIESPVVNNVYELTSPRREDPHHGH